MPGDGPPSDFERVLGGWILAMALLGWEARAQVFDACKQKGIQDQLILPHMGDAVRLPPDKVVALEHAWALQQTLA